MPIEFVISALVTLLVVVDPIGLARLLGVILAALAVQYVIDGVRAVFAG